MTVLEEAPVVTQNVTESGSQTVIEKVTYIDEAPLVSETKNDTAS